MYAHTIITIPKATVSVPAVICPSSHLQCLSLGSPQSTTTSQPVLTTTKLYTTSYSPETMADYDDETINLETPEHTIMQSPITPYLDNEYTPTAPTVCFTNTLKHIISTAKTAYRHTSHATSGTAPVATDGIRTSSVTMPTVMDLPSDGIGTTSIAKPKVVMTSDGIRTTSVAKPTVVMVSDGIGTIPWTPQGTTNTLQGIMVTKLIPRLPSWGLNLALRTPSPSHTP